MHDYRVFVIIYEASFKSVLNSLFCTDNMLALTSKVTDAKEHHCMSLGHLPCINTGTGEVYCAAIPTDFRTN